MHADSGLGKYLPSPTSRPGDLVVSATLEAYRLLSPLLHSCPCFPTPRLPDLSAPPATPSPPLLSIPSTLVSLSARPWPRCLDLTRSLGAPTPPRARRTLPVLSQPQDFLLCSIPVDQAACWPSLLRRPTGTSEAACLKGIPHPLLLYLLPLHVLLGPSPPE